MATITPEMLSEAHDWRATYQHVAIRVQDSLPEADSELAPSRRWDDGVPTDDVLEGTCAMRLGSAAQYGGQYLGAVVVVIGSDSMVDVYAEDPGEIILVAPVALAAWRDGVRVY